MKLLAKLFLLGVLIVAALPMIAPSSPVSGVIRAATADILSFCDRRPTACEDGAQFVDDTRRALVALIGTIGSATKSAAEPSALTPDDRALTPPAPDEAADGAPQLTAQDRKAAFAGHGKAFSY